MKLLNRSILSILFIVLVSFSTYADDGQMTTSFQGDVQTMLGFLGDAQNSFVASLLSNKTISVSSNISNGTGTTEDTGGGGGGIGQIFNFTFPSESTNYTGYYNGFIDFFSNFVTYNATQYSLFLNNDTMISEIVVNDITSDWIDYLMNLPWTTWLLILAAILLIYYSGLIPMIIRAIAQIVSFIIGFGVVGVIAIAIILAAIIYYLGGFVL